MEKYIALVEFARTYGLIYWLLVFTAVSYFAFRKRGKPGFEQAARIPFDEPSQGEHP